LPDLVDIYIDNRRHYQWSRKYEEGFDVNISVLESLGLIHKETLDLERRTKNSKKKIEVRVIYYHLTELGVRFCEVCCRQKVRELEAISNGGLNADKLRS
jgi:hypothetical protein